MTLLSSLTASSTKSLFGDCLRCKIASETSFPFPGLFILFIFIILLKKTKKEKKERKKEK